MQERDEERQQYQFILRRSFNVTAGGESSSLSAEKKRKKSLGVSPKLRHIAQRWPDGCWLSSSFGCDTDSFALYPSSNGLVEKARRELYARRDKLDLEAKRKKKKKDKRLVGSVSNMVHSDTCYSCYKIADAARYCLAI